MGLRAGYALAYAVQGKAYAHTLPKFGGIRKSLRGTPLIFNAIFGIFSMVFVTPHPFQKHQKCQHLSAYLPLSVLVFSILRRSAAFLETLKMLTPLS